MDADTYPQMAAAQWAEIKRRGKYRVVDARALLAYWDEQYSTYWERWGANHPDGTGLKSEFERWRARAIAATDLLKSPTDTFNFRKVLEEAIRRFAIAIEQIRQRDGKAVPSFRMPAPAPDPKPVPSPESQGIISPPADSPSANLIGGGILKWVLLYLIAREL